MILNGKYIGIEISPEYKYIKIGNDWYLFVGNEVSSF